MATSDTNPEQPGAGTATPESQTSPATTPPAGQPAEGTQETQPQYVTVDQLSQFGKQLANQLKQSDRDRTKRIEGEIAGLREIMQKANVNLAPEQEAVLREEIGARIDGAEPTQEPAEQITQPGSPEELVAQFISDTFAEVGTQVARNDPEWADLQKVLDASWNDPKGAPKVLRAAIKAAETKAARLANNQDQAAARVSGPGGGLGGEPPAKNASDLWSGAYKT